MPPRRDILLDTGPLVAILDRSDRWHAECLARWNELGARCLTTEAVLTEATHLVSRGGAPAHVPLDFLLAAQVEVVQLEPSGRAHAARLMHRYHEVPMDYADATLVVAADAASLRVVFTLDRRGFRAYRRRDGASFDAIP